MGRTVRRVTERAPKFKTVAIAAAQMESANRDSWALADAVLGDIPAQAMGRPAGNSQHMSGVSVEDRLEELAEALHDSGITTPNGDNFYTASSLRTMRDTAMAWSTADRHDEAAYRTHQEAGSGRRGRLVLSSLCKVAQGKRVGCPKMPGNTPPADQISEDAWKAAAASVRAKRDRKNPPRYLVSANDVRLALERKTNTPAPQDVQGLLDSLVDIESRLQDFVQDFAAIEASDDWDENVKAALLGSVSRVVDKGGMLIAALQGDDLDDELSQLIEDES